MNNFFESLPTEVADLKEKVLVLQNLIKGLVNTSNDQAEVIGVDDVSKLTGYSKHTIYQYVHRKTIPFHKANHGGRKLIFYRTEIADWLKGKKPETSEEFCERKGSELLNNYKGELN